MNQLVPDVTTLRICLVFQRQSFHLTPSSHYASLPARNCREEAFLQNDLKFGEKKSPKINAVFVRDTFT